MSMTNKEARAILQLSEAVRRAVDRFRKKDGISSGMREHAEAYWLGHLDSIAKGSGYGSMPVEAAAKQLDEAEVS